MSRTRKKLLLMGKSRVGKTSMRSIIFANYLARETKALFPTLNVENTQVKLLGNLVLNLWDCGGQDAFMEGYFERQRDNIFRNVEVLIYVFDIESVDRKDDVEKFRKCLDAVASNSPNAHIFCLIHKMDLITNPTERDRVLAERKAELTELSRPLKITCFGTSIWDETLYKAWSTIVYELVPNIDKLEAQLGKFCALSQADEVVLFEKQTFLVISHATHTPHPDVHRYEKISNIIKQFKLSCRKTQERTQFLSMEVKNRNFSAFIDMFTTNTYIMIVHSPHIESAATHLNIQVARPHFEKFVLENNIALN
jgi:Ras-related GTP-binding protein A/B